MVRSAWRRSPLSGIHGAGLLRRTLAMLSIRPQSRHLYHLLSLPCLFSSDRNHSGEDDSVVSSAASILAGLRRRSRWNHLRSVHPAGFTAAQATGIILRLRNNPRLALRFFLWSEHHHLCRHDALSYSAAIHTLARGRLRSAAQSLITAAFRLLTPEDLLRSLARTYTAGDSAPFVFDLLVRACLQSGKVDAAVEIVRRLRRRRISTAMPTADLLIKTVCKVKGIDAGMAIFGEIFGEDCGRLKLSPPNVHIFNRLLLSCYREEMFDKLEETKLKMCELGCNLNLYSYSILMAAAFDQNKGEDAMNLWKDMKRKQIAPDAMAYNTLIRGFCECGQVERGEALVREMVMGGMEPTCVTYEHLIRGHCQVGGVQPALVLYDDMRRKGFRPEAPVVDELMRELCINGKVCDGLQVLRSTLGIEGFFPGRKSYECVIRGLCGEGRMDEAHKLQAEMVGKGYEPDIELYNAFIQGYTKVGDMENLRKLEGELAYMGFNLAT